MLKKGTKFEPKHVCPYCGKKFRYEGYLKKHIDKEHRPENTVVNTQPKEVPPVKLDPKDDPSNETPMEKPEPVGSDFDIEGFFLGTENQLNEVYPIALEEQGGGGDFLNTSPNTVAYNNPSPAPQPTQEEVLYEIGMSVEFFEMLNDTLNSFFDTNVFKMSTAQRRALKKALDANGFAIADPMMALVGTLIMMYVPPFILLGIQRGWFNNLADKFNLEKIRNVFDKNRERE